MSVIDNLDKVESEVLHKLEEILRIEIPKLDKVLNLEMDIEGNIYVTKSKFGYSLKNNHLTELGLNFYSIGNKIKLSDVPELKIRDLLKSLSKCKYLKTLDLTGHYLNLYLELFNGLDSLQTLILTENNLGNLPDTLLKMPKLALLKLDNNKIERLPPWFKNLNYLKILDLRNNIFSQIPEQLSRMSNLLSLQIEKNQIEKSIGNDELIVDLSAN